MTLNDAKTPENSVPETVKGIPMAADSNEMTKVLPMTNGNTWTIVTKPNFGRIKLLQPTADPTDLIRIVTVEWTFPEEITNDAIDTKRELDDVIAVMTEVSETVLPLLARLETMKSVQKLLGD